MIERTAKDALLRLASQFAVVGITGPRQSGKTTLAKMAFPEKRYISFDDKNIRELAAANPTDFLLAFPDGAIIDEAQKVPEVFDAVKYHIDQNAFTPGKFILTGSNQFNLKQNMTDSLAGRAAFLKLLPFSIGELQNGNILGPNVYEMIFKGCYPPLYDSAKHFTVDDWFNSYVDTYLDLDVERQINYSNLSVFKKFIQICATYSGQMLSMDSIARGIGVSAPTVKQWLSILESSFIIHLLEPDTQNLGKSLVKTPKLYFIDSGLLCHLLRIESVEELILSEHKGAIIESFAIAEMLKNRLNLGKQPNLTFYRDQKGFEVDTIADWKHTFAIEIKSTIEAEQNLSKNTRDYLALRGNDGCRGAVFYLGDLTLSINGIDYVSWKDWGNYAMK
jgi:predicted AAA+ superfamily ATPase